MFGDVGFAANLALNISELVTPLIDTVSPELIANARASDVLPLS